MHSCYSPDEQLLVRMNWGLCMCQTVHQTLLGKTIGSHPRMFLPAGNTERETKAGKIIWAAIVHTSYRSARLTMSLFLITFAGV